MSRLHDLRLTARGKAGGLRRRAVAAVLSVAPVRRRLRRRALAALEGNAPLTFVCYGNICRSPFAEAIARRHLRADRAIASAGTYPQGGRRSPSVAVAAAQAWSVDLHSHRSRVLDAELVREGGALFAFDVDNLLGLRRAFPHARDRIHLLGALASDGPLVIPDPYGRGPEQFLAAYERINALIGAAAPAKGERGR